MNTCDVSAYSGERLSFIQLFSQKRLQVEIPIIQRDYAQGRENQHAVRSAFLDALHEYLQKGEPFQDLDFVYGSIIEDKTSPDEGETAGRFVPLDGQQRLTTLFLLHWYLAQISGKAEFLRGQLSANGRSLFSYETRSSSKEFCDALMANDIDFNCLLELEPSVESVALTIKDAGWFYLSWSSDPSISAMLTMLDAIHNKFKHNAEYFERLVDSEQPVITFLFLNLQEFKLTDDLYIKMNARGKPLTHFENFKARLQKKIKTFTEPWPEYSLSFQESNVSGYDYFIHKIDTDWADLFWDYRNEASADNTYDDELMNFIALVVANFHIVSRGLERSFFGDGGVLKKFSINEYETLGCLTQSLIEHLINMFDLLHHNKLIGAGITPYLEVNPYYSEEATFKKIIKNNTSYTEKLRFYAFYAALGKGVKNEGLLSWMRVVFNLSENIIINTVDDYERSLKSIRDLLQRDVCVLEQLRSNENVSGFHEAQILEEKVKAHLFIRSAEWKSRILDLEKHVYFRGQIGFILKFSGIIDYYQEHGNTDWGAADSNYLDSFVRYASSASAVFSCIAESSEKIDYAWERAVLSKGDYLTATSANRFNLLSTRLAKNNIERDHSWKRLLRLPSSKDEQWHHKQSFVKAVFDDCHFDAKDISGSLEAICNKAVAECSEMDWRMLFVKTPELFKKCKQGFIVKSDSEIVLLHESQRNHYHSELFSKFLYLQLKSEGFDGIPFENLEYEPQKSSENYTFISLENFSLSGFLYEMEVWYEADQYQVLFVGHDRNNLPIDILEILGEHGFSEYKECDGYENAYSCVRETPDDAKHALKELCMKLRRLV